MTEVTQTLFSRIKLRKWLIFSTLLLIIIFTLIFQRVQAAKNLRISTEKAAITRVSVITAQADSGSDTIILPGNVMAWHEAPIYARVNGYVRKWYVDIGAPVKFGDLLAVIETPELDAQQRQAKADLNNAKANNALAKITAKRWVNLLKTESVSKQETDEKISAAKALQATMIAAKANLDRLNELVNFQKIVAPFDGVITARATDIGDLVDAGSSVSAKPLFRVAQTNPLRLYVRVPQFYTAQLQKNMHISLHFAEYPHHVFTGELLDTAKAIDPLTRTLLTQFKVDNSQGILLAGAYTEVWFTLPLPPHTIRIPVNALIFQAPGLQVATVTADQKIKLKKISVRRDFGTEVEIAAGITSGEKIVINPPDALYDGESVRVQS